MIGADPPVYPAPVNSRAAATRDDLREARSGGGLSTYGIIALREPVAVALAEVEMIARLGVKIETGVEVGVDLDAAELQRDSTPSSSAVGLAATPDRSAFPAKN